MAEKEELLIKNGFIKNDYAHLYKGISDEEFKNVYDPSHADIEVWEQSKDQFLKTEYPTPLKRFRIILEKPNQSIEEAYYWVYGHTHEFLGYPNVDKIVDTFAASENSAFFGVSQQRLGLQQDKVSQFLATIGKMVKELFQLVRELRIIDERLGYYKASWGLDEEGKKTKKPSESAEITLKGIWIDMVQGGAKNPASVYGMAREVQFLSLPDLFFSTNPQNPEEIDKIVDTQRSGFNKTVRNVLKRQLEQYMRWKKETYVELKNRRLFTLKYLRQHYDIIHMYITWVKPYIKNVQRLSLSEGAADSPEMISAFEGSMIEIEFLAYKQPVEIKKKASGKRVYATHICSFFFRTRPAMSYQQEGYQRGPIHVGKLEINLRAYAWDDKQIQNFKNLKSEQDIEMLKSVSDSVKTAMESLGDDLRSYLKESGEKFPEDEKKTEKKESKPGIWDQIKADFIGEQSTSPKKQSKPKSSKELKAEGEKKGKDKSLASKTAKGDLFLTFKNFKKSHGLVMW